MKNKETVIHVGLHKTGTTFLQERLFPKAESFALLTRPYTQHNHAFNKLQYADDTLFNLDEFKEEIRRVGSERLLLSDESFAGKPVGFGYINRSLIARRLAKVFPEAKIILFLRGQQSILKSHYNNWVRGYTKGDRTIEEFVWSPSSNYTLEDYKNNKEPNLNSLFWNTNKFYTHLDCYLYYQLIQLYKSLFNDVHVFLYEDFLNKPKELLAKVNEVLEENIKLKDEDFRQKVNNSVPDNELSSVLVRNKLSRGQDNKWHKVLTFGALKLGEVVSQKVKEVSTYEETLDRITKNHYNENNRKIINDYPEIGLQNYGDKYLT